MVCERLSAVAKDRDHMRKRAQEQARQLGKSYDEIMVRNNQKMIILYICVYGLKNTILIMCGLLYGLWLEVPVFDWLVYLAASVK